MDRRARRAVNGKPALIALAVVGAFSLTVSVFRWLRRRRERAMYGSM
jgi:hypothetical protein